ncbi:capsular polysaccharide biosynthesis protein [Bacterioplanoides sp. SCSIO 12839]|uniref:capsular polysaccharide biosynthesis protein n=1 Tax=Bacterioplanoides sp. SCSIO 12839 TaxID=2829569 RepID=UPI002107B0A7|nr:capsular polysaccharide biosynthesis protein [Bacterioplanoides sp. SCSIO 12839]UTW47822.1 capsular polysaccharide biosynthesis protein [Bacterioplanoides sp. SCSIO 12839]
MSLSEQYNTIWTASAGIRRFADLLRFLDARSLKRCRASASVTHQDVVVGWGVKPNTQAARSFAEQKGLSYLALEDGFFCYSDHSSVDTSRLSLICDATGIYYDARLPSDLEGLCNSVSSWMDESYLKRARSVLNLITQYGLSKYNQVRQRTPEWLERISAPCILVVDQTRGDQSITGALASSDSFAHMLQRALNDHPEAHVLIKTHPDVLKGKKQAHYDATDVARCPERIHLLTDDVALPELMAKVSDVYTVSSQLGFEALCYGKKVHCFGMPFYAGWGLTQDRLACSRRVSDLSLEQLVAAAVLRYPRYLHPDTGLLCEAEAVLNWLVLQVEKQSDAVDVCFAYGFSLWKRSFIPEFVGRSAQKICFVNDENKLRTRLAQSHGRAAVLFWGRGEKELAESLSTQAKTWFIEDGFLRSVGLGADLRRPSSLVLDAQGMYYDPASASDIVSLLNQVTSDSFSVDRINSLLKLIQRAGISKYNVGIQGNAQSLIPRIQQASAGREIILVPGQFEGDLSVKSSLGDVKTNAELLARTRARFPDSFLIFKEHPDLYSGVRPGLLGEKEALKDADFYTADVDISVLLDIADRVSTLTSLTGFEALLRQKQVTVFGSPFYAGWGLTDDLNDYPERQQQLSLQALAYVVLIQYPRYINWNTRLFTTPEVIVEQLIHERSGHTMRALRSNWVSRQARKLSYLIEAYRK